LEPGIGSGQIFFDIRELRGLVLGLRRDGLSELSTGEERGLGGRRWKRR
jgi:hypothetical protein